MTLARQDAWDTWVRRQKVLGEFEAERLRQIDLWGVQTHPDFDPDIPRDRGDLPLRVAYRYDLPTAHSAKRMCDAESETEAGSSWTSILTEEFAEAIEAAALLEPVELRTELVQVAAVALAWIEDIDRKAREASA